MPAARHLISTRVSYRSVPKLMPRWLVYTTYASAVGLLFSSDLSMWIALVFPFWVLLVSVLALVRSGVIDLHHDDGVT